MSVLMRIQMAYQGKEPQRKPYENINIKILKHYYSVGLNTGLLWSPAAAHLLSR